MYTMEESTPDRGTDPLSVRTPTDDDGEPPVAGTLTGRPATTGAQRGATSHVGLNSLSGLLSLVTLALFWTATHISVVVSTLTAIVLVLRHISLLVTGS